MGLRSCLGVEISGRRGSFGALSGWSSAAGAGITTALVSLSNLMDMVLSATWTSRPTLF